MATSTPAIYDVTLRDGNHALRHQLSARLVREYCKRADQANLWAVEVGHGNGLGASSFLVGQSETPDEELLIAARAHLNKTRLAVHAIPGFATVARDLHPALELGVDVFRIATHVTEASLAQTHVEFLVNRGATVHGVLMMCHMADLAHLENQARLFESYGATALILMDSAGHLTPPDVVSRVRAVRESTQLTVGFHAHNNLGVGVANAFAAVDAGAEIADGASMGLGAGSGNAQLECVGAVLERSGLAHLNLEALLDMSRLIDAQCADALPKIGSSSVESGMAGVFSGYAPQVMSVASEMGVKPSDLWREMGRRRLVAGQESMIREIALDLMNL